MLYKNFKTDEVFNQVKLEEVAQLEGITVDEYITKYDLQMIPDFDSAENEMINFPQDTTEEIATAVSGDVVSNQNITDLDLETVSLESVYEEKESDIYASLRKAEAELARVEKSFSTPLLYLAKVKAAKDRITEEKNKLYSADSEINFDVPETVIYKSSDQVITALTKEYPSINFKQTQGYDEGINVDLGGEILKLSLDPWTSVGEEEAKDVLEKIKNYDAKLNANQRLTGVAMGLWGAYENEEISTDFLNEQLNLMGLELIPYQEEGFTDGIANRGTQLVDKATGKVLAQDQSGMGRATHLLIEGNIQAYLRNKLKPEQTKALYDKSFEILSTAAELKALTKQEQEELIKKNPSRTWAAYAKSGFGNILEHARIAGLSEEEITFLENGLKDLERYLGGGVDLNNLDTLNKAQMAAAQQALPLTAYKENIERYLSGDELSASGHGVLQALPPELVEKLLQGNWLENGLKSGLEDTQRKELQKITEPLYQNILGDLGEDHTLLDLAKRWEGLPTDILRDEIDKKVKFVQQADENIGKILDFKLNEIYNALPKGSRINYVDINGDVVAELAWEGDRALSKGEKENFDEQATEFYKLQTTIKRLQKEKKEYVFQVIQNTKLIKDYNEDVDHELTDLAFKEYDLGSLVARDFWNATKSIGLTVPTLLGSNWAQNEQKLMNMDDKYYKTMVAPELSLEYVLRTLGQQMPNVIMAIGTGAVGSKFLSDAAVKWAIASTFGFSSGTEKYRQLNIQQDLHQTALDQRRILTKAYDEGRLDEFMLMLWLI